jgi:hypothetical protein
MAKHPGKKPALKSNSNKRAIASRQNARFGGLGRAARYEPLTLSEWASKGGKAVLQRYGREYFVELRKRRKNYSKHSEPTVFQPNVRLMEEVRARAARENGRKGGNRRAELFLPKCRQAMAREGGIATRNRYGSDFFREIRKRRKSYPKGYITKKTKQRILNDAIQHMKTEENWALKHLWRSVALNFSS